MIIKYEQWETHSDFRLTSLCSNFNRIFLIILIEKITKLTWSWNPKEDDNNSFFAIQHVKGFIWLVRGDVYNKLVTQCGRDRVKGCESLLASTGNE